MMGPYNQHNKYVMGRHEKIAQGLVVLTLCLVGTTVRADASNWSRQLRNSPIDGENDCVLTSKTKSLFDGYQNTRVHLELDAKGLEVISDSNLDFGGKLPLGVTVDGGDFFPADGLDGETRLRFSHDFDLLVQDFIKGIDARLRLRFWPTWPATGDKTIDFSLMGFAKAYHSHCS